MPSQSNQWDVRNKKFSELIMKIAGEVFVACAVPIIVEQPETSHRIVGDKRCFITEEMFIVHEVHLVAIEEHSSAQIKYLHGRGHQP